MKCPFRKITTFEYNYSSLGNGSHNIQKTEESFGSCYGDDCPFYFTDGGDVPCCGRTGVGEEGDDD